MWNRYELGVFIVFFILIGIFTKTYPVSSNDESRLAATQSIVEKGTFAIDNSMFNSTIDKVKIGDHFYSDKPMLSYLILVPIYHFLYYSGITMENNLGLVYFILSLLTIGLSTSIMLVYFYRFLKRYNLSPGLRLFYTTALGLGTLVFVYSLVINSHGLAAAFLFLSFYAVVNAKKPINYAFAGLLTGLTVTFEIAGGPIFLACFIGLMLWKKVGIKNIIWFCIFAAIPIIAYLGINYEISGSIIPVQVRVELFDYPGSEFAGGIGVSGYVKWDSYTDLLKYAWGVTFGRKGLFTYSLPLFFSLAGIIFAIIRKNKYRDEAIAIGTGILLTLLFYITKTNNWGGCNFGFRFTVPLIPMLFAFTPILFKEIRSKRLWYLFVLVFFFSLAITALGVYLHTWNCDQQMIPFLATR